MRITLLEFDGFVKYHAYTPVSQPPSLALASRELGPLLLHLSLWDFRSCTSFVLATVTHILTRRSLEKKEFSWLTVGKSSHCRLGWG